MGASTAALIGGQSLMAVQLAQVTQQWSDASLTKCLHACLHFVPVTIFLQHTESCMTSVTGRTHNPQSCHPELRLCVRVDNISAV